MTNKGDGNVGAEKQKARWREQGKRYRENIKRRKADAHAASPPVTEAQERESPVNGQRKKPGTPIQQYRSPAATPPPPQPKQQQLPLEVKKARTSSALEAALAYLRDGLVPIPSKDKRPLVAWKQFQERRPSEDEVREWFEKWPDAGIQLVCGWNGLAVIDVDEPELTDWLLYLLDVPGAPFTGLSVVDANDPDLKDWLLHLSALVDTRVVRTPSGGLHIYVTEPLPSKSGPVFPGVVDVKAAGGLISAPPTPGYEVVLDAPIKRAEYSAVQLATTLITGAIRGNERLREKFDSALMKAAPDVRGNVISEGERNTRLASMAGSMRRQGLTPAEIESELLLVNERRCDPPLSEDEVHRIAYSVAQYSTGPRGYNDAENGERLIDRFGAELRYSYPWDKWLVWIGTHWQIDDGSIIEERAVKTARAIYQEADEADDGKEREEIKNWANTSLSRGKQIAMIRSAQHLVPIKPDTLDTDHWLLNCENGTLDLRKGELRPHSQDDYITKLVPVAYDPKERAPRWEAFLERVIPNDETLAYVQRAVGYSFTGDTSEHALFFLHGSGANGKSTFLNTLLKLLQGYAGSASPGLLVQKRGDSHPTGTADLAGKRLVVSHEAGEGSRIDEEFLKQATGGDELKARRMREDFWGFQPTHKIWWTANHKPDVIGTDEGLWRRLKLVPFTVQIPFEERDLQLGHRLLDERAGVLAWAVRGCLAWQQIGLAEPAQVTLATEEYRAETDILGAWIEECAFLGPEYKEMGGVLFKDYEGWCLTNGHRSMSSTKFGRKLTDRGYPAKPVAAGKLRLGIALRSSLRRTRVIRDDE